MIVHLRHRRASWALLAVSLLCSVVYFSRIAPFPTGIPLPVDSSRGAKDDVSQTAVTHPPSPELVMFWKQLLAAMMRTKPQTPPVEVPFGVGDREMDPNHSGRDSTRADRIDMPENDIISMSRSHGQFVTLAKELAPSLPFKKGSRGIVMTAGGKYFGIAITSLLMLRQTGTKLPVQLFLDTKADYDEEICEHVLPSLDAECVIMGKVWELTPSMPKMEKYQFKVFSIIFSTFQEVLFLDADCWPIRKPDYLFNTEPYKSRGLITWPDFWLSTASPLFYEITNIDTPSIETRRSSEAGILLYNKAKHADSLLLSAYYNFYGPKYYYPLLSQGATGQGDKETFLHSAIVLGKPFYDVQTHIGILGRWINGSFESAAMKQADPKEDFELALSPKKLLLNQEKYGQEGKKKDGSPHANWLFVHHNLVKIDIRNLGTLSEKLFRKNDKGQWQRLWGDDPTLREMAGYDVERTMWEMVLKTDCAKTLLAGECDPVKKWFKKVFA